jgi:hypothetical protein
VREIRDPFFTVESMKELWHDSHDTNKCENIMKVITEFHPKDVERFGTICCKGRIYGAITKDSIGLGSYLERILELMGVRVLETMAEYGRQKDYDRVMNKKLQSSAKSWMKRVIGKSVKQRDEYKKPSYQKWLSLSTDPDSEWKRQDRNFSKGRRKRKNKK